MASYISAKKKEILTASCKSCNSVEFIVGSIRNEIGHLENYCKNCFEDKTGKKVSKR